MVGRLCGQQAPVAQLDRALPSEGKGHTFESCRVRQFNCPVLLLMVVATRFGVWRCLCGSRVRNGSRLFTRHMAPRLF